MWFFSQTVGLTSSLTVKEPRKTKESTWLLAVNQKPLQQTCRIFQPISSKTKTTRDCRSARFPRFPAPDSSYGIFVLILYSSCDWLLLAFAVIGPSVVQMKLLLLWLLVIRIGTGKRNTLSNQHSLFRLTSRIRKQLVSGGKQGSHFNWQILGNKTDP